MSCLIVAAERVFERGGRQGKDGAHQQRRLPSSALRQRPGAAWRGPRHAFGACPTDVHDARLGRQGHQRDRWYAQGTT